MTDTKAMINRLINGASLTCTGCPYRHDALELLKEQKPIEPKRTVDEHGQILSCGNCGAWFVVQSQKYCHECGRKVKWDG